METQSKLRKNRSKITFILALTGAISGSVALIVAAVGVHRTQGLSYYEDYDHRGFWGSSTIWAMNAANQHQILLYFGVKPQFPNDVKWDGIYPNGYFN